MARCTRKIKFWTSMEKAASAKTLSTSMFWLRFKKKIVKIYVWSIALYVPKLGCFGE
jgi:hypothetical protein